MGREKEGQGTEKERKKEKDDGRYWMKLRPGRGEK